MEVDLENVVQITDLGTNTLEQTFVEGIAEQNLTRRRLSHAEQVGQASVLVLAGLVNVDQSTTGTGGADHGDGQSRKKDERGGLGHVGLGDRGVLLLGALAGSQSDSGKTKQVVVTVPGRSVEEVVLADKEDAGQLLVVVGHHDILGGALAQVQQGVNVLDAAESFLPELQLNSNVQLLETGVQVALQGIRVAQVDGVHLGRVLGGILDVVAEQLAKTAELSLASVLETELEGLQGGGLVHDLETGIVLQDLEDGTVGLPQELQPWSNDCAIGAVPGLLTGDGGQQDGFGGLDGLQVLDVGGGGSGFEGGLDLVGLGLGLGDLLFGELDELLEDDLDGADIGVLGDVLVLVQAILGRLSLAQVDTQLDKEEHHRLEGRNRAAASPLRGNMFVENGQGGGRLADGDKFLGPL